MKTINLQDWQKSKNKEDVFAVIDSIDVFENDVLKKMFKVLYELCYISIEQHEENLKTEQAISENLNLVIESVTNLTNTQNAMIENHNQLLELVELMQQSK